MNDGAGETLGCLLILAIGGFTMGTVFLLGWGWGLIVFGGISAGLFCLGVISEKRKGK